MAAIKCLLLSGANNHDWRRSSPFIRQVLEESGKFQVTITEYPSAALENASELVGYDLIFSDYNGPEWSDTAKSNFASAIAGGTGLVVMHAADNAFPG
ncbi:MAG: ThuA domain-containing protein, partial [Armatimonadota bacterium]